MKNKHGDKKITILLTVVFVISVITVVLANDSLNKEISKNLELNKDVSVAQASDVVSLRQTFVRLENKINALNNYFIDSENIAYFIGQLEGLARNYDLFIDIQNVDLVEATRNQKKQVGSNVVSEEVKAHGELNMVLRVVGSWANVSQFLIALEKADKIINFKGVRLASSVNSETEQVEWSALFNIQILTD